MRTVANLAGLETPCLLLDEVVLRRNAERFANIAISHGVRLRPHLKTSKSVDVANILTAGSDDPGVTVSTLAEAEYFADNGYRDILYAVGMVPGKLERVAHIQQKHGIHVLLVTDNTTVAKTAADFCKRKGVELHFLLEVDCGDKRGGIPPDADAVLDIAAILQGSTHVKLQGVMTHAGQSYATSISKEIAGIAEQERAAVVLAAERLAAAGFEAPVVSVGSTPTVLFAESLEGVTEVRCGVYAFFDLDQYGRTVCDLGDIALSVLASVIGHNLEAGIILVDAGGLALSKDTSASSFLPDAGFGYVCHAETLERFGNLSINGVNQEHGKIKVDSPSWFSQLPIGSQVRILPNHACFTAAAYPGYRVLTGSGGVGYWPRVNGW